MTPWKFAGLCWLWATVFMWAMGIPGEFANRPKPAPIQFGYDGRPEDLKVRLAQLDVLDVPYKPDTPQPGERGYGVPKVTVQGGGSTISGPIEVIPVYYCTSWGFVNPQGTTYKSNYPCETPSEHYGKYRWRGSWNEWD